MSLKDSFHIISTVGGCGGLERTDFELFADLALPNYYL